MLQALKKEIKLYLEEYYQKKYQIDIQIIVEQPKSLSMGDISVPVFSIVKSLKKTLPECVIEVREQLLSHFSIIKEINPTGGFLNIVVYKAELAVDIITKTIEAGSEIGKNNLGEGKVVALDYSSPNIAKSFSIGHLRSTMIGNSLKLIYEKCGFQSKAINYLGDWGTQFGKMIVAFEKWGDRKKIEQDPINELTRLYVLFHDKAKEDPTLEDEGRAAFRKLELGEPSYLELWKWIREESLKESEQIYQLLNIGFDSYHGEAYYNDKMDPIVEELQQKGLLKEDQGAQIVDLGEDIPPALIQRKDGGSLYITRDLAAIFDRERTYGLHKMLYVVGNEQKLHFNQLKRLLVLMGYDLAEKIHHINFGLVLKDGKKMSTRSGGVVKLYDVLEQAIEMANHQITAKNPNLEEKEIIAQKVGVGAIVFNDLKNHRTLEVEFDMEKMLKFEGQTGPYLQYTGVRIASILRDAVYDYNQMKKDLLEQEHYFDLVRTIGEFESMIVKACQEDAPSVIAKYLLSLAQSFNRFYSLEKINAEDTQTRNTNMALAYCTRTVINEGLRLLGIDYVERM